MLSLDEAIDQIAASVFRDHAPELAEVYRKYPTRKGQPRKTLNHIVAHAIRVHVSAELKRVRELGSCPTEVENTPAVDRIQRKVFDRLRARQ